MPAGSVIRGQFSIAVENGVEVVVLTEGRQLEHAVIELPAPVLVAVVRHFILTLQDFYGPAWRLKDLLRAILLDPDRHGAGAIGAKRRCPQALMATVTNAVLKSRPAPRVGS